jgi:serine O-acetyltransferase
MARTWVSTIDRSVVRLVEAQRRPVVGRAATLVLRLLGVHIPPQVVIGEGLLLPHSTTGCVIHAKTRIGDRVTIFHGVTVGRADAYDVQPAPLGGAVIGDDVVLCAGAVVLPKGTEPLLIGRGTVVGANAVLTTSTGQNEVWAGNPARRIRTTWREDRDAQR